MHMHILLLYILYLLYIQFSPGMGNIWYRNNEYFSPMGAVNMTLSPLYLYYMWHPSMWDLNFVMWICIYFIIHKLFFLYFQNNSYDIITKT
jgi:hypothetical protein